MLFISMASHSKIAVPLGDLMLGRQLTCVKVGAPIEKPREKKEAFICLPKPSPSTTRTRIDSAMENMEVSHSHQNT